MSFQDFTSNFQKLEICNLGPDTFEEPGTKKRWEATNQDGAWRKRVNAGGCRNYLGRRSGMKNKIKSSLGCVLEDDDNYIR